MGGEGSVIGKDLPLGGCHFWQVREHYLGLGGALPATLAGSAAVPRCSGCVLTVHTAAHIYANASREIELWVGLQDVLPGWQPVWRSTPMGHVVLESCYRVSSRQL